MILTAEDVVWFHVDDATVTGTVRRAAVDLSRRAGFTDSRSGEVAISATEATTNQLKHAGGGTVLLRRVRDGERCGVEFVASDAGPGMRNVPAAMLDGASTTGTLGIGLGAIRRLASSCDLHSVPGRGTVVTARFWPGTGDASPRAEGLSRPMTGEDVCGDRWAVRAVGRSELLLVADGLGHGPLAARAASEAVDVFHAADTSSPADLLRAMHAALRPTRGAAVAVARVDGARGQLVFAGIGNITGVLTTDDRRTHLMSYPGIVGHQVRTVRELCHPLPEHWTVVLHSDGLRDRWDLGDYPGLVTRSPLVVAATLLRDAGVRRDDAGVLVARSW